MSNEIIWRLGAFFVGLVVFSIWEALAPRRKRKIPRKIRWPRNIGLSFSGTVLVNLVNSVLVRFLVPVSAGFAAIWASDHGVGLFHLMGWSGVGVIVVSIVLLDLVVYGQHVFFHWHPWLWRLHMVHHVDQELDATSGIRFHPVEILLSLILKMGVVVLLGVPFLGVVLFEIVLNMSAMFNHGNIRLPDRVDRVLRQIIVTPDMHRVHHSVLPKETHSNFGFNLSIWDKIFGTYRSEPKAGQLGMTLGLPGYSSVENTGLWWMISAPFRRKRAPTQNKEPS